MYIFSFARSCPSSIFIIVLNSLLEVWTVNPFGSFWRRSISVGSEHLNLLYIYIYIHLTNRFHVAVRLFRSRSQMTSKCGKNKKVESICFMSLMVLPQFDVFCDLLLNRRTGTWNLFVLYHYETNYYT